MQALIHNPGILALGILILVLAGALTWHLTHPKVSPGPDTRIQRALRLAEDHGERLDTRKPPVPQARVSVEQVRPVPYQRLRENADRRIADEGPLTTELAAVTSAQIEADRRNQLLRVAQRATPVSTDTVERSLLDMSVAEMMEQIVRDSATAVIPVVRPQTAEQPLSTERPDRRVHAELPDGSEVVRYERAGKWFHEAPGLRTKLTLGQAAILAATPGALVRSGVPGGGMFDLRVKKAREEQS